MNTNEKSVKPMSGYIGLLFALILVVGTIFLLAIRNPAGFVLLFLFLLMLPGFFYV
jgi:hypothetical protein